MSVTNAFREVACKIQLTFTVTGPGARGRITRIASTTTNALNQAISKTSNAVGKLIVAASVPLGAVATRDSVTSREGNVHYVIAVVTRITIDTAAEAGGSKGDRGLANHGLWTIVAILVAPNAVNLGHS